MLPAAKTSAIIGWSRPCLALRKRSGRPKARQKSCAAHGLRWGPDVSRRRLWADDPRQLSLAKRGLAADAHRRTDPLLTPRAGRNPRYGHAKTPRIAPAREPLGGAAGRFQRPVHRFDGQVDSLEVEADAESGERYKAPLRWEVDDRCQRAISGIDEERSTYLRLQGGGSTPLLEMQESANDHTEESFAMVDLKAVAAALVQVAPRPLFTLLVPPQF